jgi:hypothetical protein
MITLTILDGTLMTSLLIDLFSIQNQNVVKIDC